MWCAEPCLATWLHAPRRSWPALLLAALSGLAGAHESGGNDLPATPGWRAGAAAALVWPGSPARWPAAPAPGVLTTGTAVPDQRGAVRLEHGTLDAAVRPTGWFGAHVALGWHDRDGSHVEAAQVRLLQRRAASEFELAIGRGTVPMGEVVDGAGHFDRFSQVPLAKQAAFDGPWQDDGLSLAWRRPGADGLRGVQAGLWRGRSFPGGPGGRVAPSLRLHGGWGHLDVNLAAVRLHPQGRGAALTQAGSVGHAHGSLDCRVSLQQRVCFDGTSDILGASARWETEDAGWQFAAGALSRRERGALYTNAANTGYSGRLAGGWVDAVWQAAGRWTLAARLERLSPRHTLEGVGATTLARDAGLAGAATVERATVAGLYALPGGPQLALEAGTEHRADGRQRHVALRLLWQAPDLVGGAW